MPPQISSHSRASTRRSSSRKSPPCARCSPTQDGRRPSFRTGTRRPAAAASTSNEASEQFMPKTEDEQRTPVNWKDVPTNQAGITADRIVGHLDLRTFDRASFDTDDFRCEWATASPCWCAMSLGQCIIRGGPMRCSRATVAITASLCARTSRLPSPSRCPWATSLPPLARTILQSKRRSDAAIGSSRTGRPPPSSRPSSPSSTMTSTGSCRRPTIPLAREC